MESWVRRAATSRPNRPSALTTVLLDGNMDHLDLSKNPTDIKSERPTDLISKSATVRFFIHNSTDFTSRTYGVKKKFRENNTRKTISSGKL